MKLCTRTPTNWRNIPERNIRLGIGNFPKIPNPSTFSKAVPYKWDAHRSTNRRDTANVRCMAGFPFFHGLEANMLKVQRYTLGAYCRTNWRSTALLLRQVARVGGLLPKHCPLLSCLRMSHRHVLKLSTCEFMHILKTLYSHCHWKSAGVAAWKGFQFELKTTQHGYPAPQKH